MFERFTDRARRIVVLAQEEARRLDHNYIGTEHILLGLIREPDGVAAQALTAVGISLEALRTRTEEVVGRGGSTPEGYIPFTPRAKKVLELSLREALHLGHNYVGTEHVLLAMLRERDGVGAQVLVQLGAEPQRVGEAVIDLLSAYSAPEARGATAAVGTTDGPTPPDPPRVRTWAEPSQHNRTRWWEPLPERCVLCARDLWEADHYVSGVQGSVCEGCVGA